MSVPTIVGIPVTSSMSFRTIAADGAPTSAVEFRGVENVRGAGRAQFHSSQSADVALSISGDRVAFVRRLSQPGPVRGQSRCT